MNIQITVAGQEDLKKAFDNSPKLIAEEFKGVIGRAAFTLEGKAKGYAPRKTGVLASSIHTEGPSISGVEVSARVGTNLSYAPYQEFGTGIYAGKGMITPKRAKVLAWRDGGRWVFARAVKGVPARKYFQRAREETLPLLSGLLKGALGSIVVRLAKD